MTGIQCYRADLVAVATCLTSGAQLPVPEAAAFLAELPLPTLQPGGRLHHAAAGLGETLSRSDTRKTWIVLTLL